MTTMLRITHTITNPPRALPGILPDELCELTQMHTLYLHNNNLQTLPNNIGRMESLEVFEILSHRCFVNSITWVPYHGPSVEVLRYQHHHQCLLSRGLVASCYLVYADNHCAKSRMV